MLSYKPTRRPSRIPIGLGAADKAAGKALPQIIMVITGPEEIKAADFSTPTPASVLLPRILDEIGAKDLGIFGDRQIFPPRRVAWTPMQRRRRVFPSCLP